MKLRSFLYCMAMAAASIAQAGYTPVAIQSSSYNADVVVESNATPRLDIVTSASIDNGTNNTANTLFEVGYDTNNPGNGVPLHGSVLVSQDNPNFTFQMPASYVGPNGLLIGSDITNGTFTLTTPKAYTILSFLGLGGNGGDSVKVTVHHQDGSSENEAFATSDWFGGTVGLAVIMGGRCNSTVNLTTEVDGTSGDGLGNPRIYHKEITLMNTSSPVTSVDLFYTGGSPGAHSDIMALSGGASTALIAPIVVTGYDYDFVVEATAPHDNRVLSQTIEAGTNIWATSASMDNDTDTATSWYERGYNLNNSDSGNFNNPNANLTGTGLPHPGAMVTNFSGDHIYQMPGSYITNDAVYISDTVTNDTITLTTPAAFTGLTFLGSAGNGPVTVNVVIHHGATTENTTLTVADWFSSGTAVLQANGRVAVDSAQFSNIEGGAPSLFANDIALADSTDPVTSIDLINTNNSASANPSGRFSVFAVSGTTGALPPIISVQPISTNEYAGTVVSLSGAATANAPLTYQWQFQSNGVWTNLSNGGNISGTTSTTLTFNPLEFQDQGNYQLVATDSAGSLATATATVNVFSSENDVTQPGDPISGVNISPFSDGSPAFAIDNSMDTKFGANISGGISGLVVSPAVGLTVVNAVRLYTGADSTGRDPTSFVFYGSLNGGSSYTLISSNGIVLTDNRNPLTGVAPDPLTQFVTEVRFPNTVGYTTYKITFPTLKGSGSVQFQEMELLGTNETGVLFISTQPTNANVFEGSSASFTAIATANPAPTVSWYRGANGTYSALTDGGHIAGSQTSTLTVNPASFADALDYIAVAHSGSQFVTSAVAHLFVYTTTPSIVQPSDTITEFGDTTGTRYADADPALLIDGTTSPWQNGGSGPSAGAGFPPFQGPVGVIVTPSAGATVLTGLRFYSGQDGANSDPSDYTLEGSNNGGTSYTTISSGSLSLPLARSVAGNPADPTLDPVQEVLFANTEAFTSYRLTFPYPPSVRDPSTASYLEVGEVQFLGTIVTGPSISTITLSGGNVTITGTGGPANGTFEVLTNGVLGAPLSTWGTNFSGSFDASGNLSVEIPVTGSKPGLFYVIKTP